MKSLSIARLKRVKHCIQVSRRWIVCLKWKVSRLRDWNPEMDVCQNLIMRLTWNDQVLSIARLKRSRGSVPVKHHITICVDLNPKELSISRWKRIVILLDYCSHIRIVTLDSKSLSIARWKLCLSLAPKCQDTAVAFLTRKASRLRDEKDLSDYRDWGVIQPRFIKTWELNTAISIPRLKLCIAPCNVSGIHLLLMLDNQKPLDFLEIEYWDPPELRVWINSRSDLETKSLSIPRLKQWSVDV